MRASPRREVHRADALVWLREAEVLAGCSIVTSLPDVSELAGMDLPRWRRWFVEAVALVLSRCPDDGVAIFYQSDVKKAGAWIDKGYLCSRAAEDAGFTTLWHKIVCRHPPGSITHGRPAYSHLLCFSRGVRLDLSRAQPDVLADPGKANWTRGMGTEACRLACRFVRRNTASRTVVDPFCGRGMVLAVANAEGLDAVGVEISARRARQARALQVEGR